MLKFEVAQHTLHVRWTVEKKDLVETAIEMQAKIIVLKNGTHTGQIILNCILLMFLC